MRQTDRLGKLVGKERTVKIIVKIADPAGHKQKTMTMEGAIEAFPFFPQNIRGIVAVDSVVMATKDEFGKKLSELVDAKREEVVVDVVPQIAGG